MTGEQGEQNDILRNNVLPNNILVDARWLGENRTAASVALIDTRPAAEFRAGH